MKAGYKKTEIGIIPEDWEVLPFRGILITNIKHGIYKNKDYINPLGIRILKMGIHYSNNKIGQQEMERISITENELNRFKIKEGNLIFSRTSMMLDGAGKCSIVISHKDPIIFDGNLLCAELNEKLVYPKYYYYFFNSNLAKREIAKITTGTQSRNISGSKLMMISVPILSLPEQKAIAKVLTDLDDKIELNKEMNKTLEEIGHTLFKRWFIDFEFPDENGNPYRSSGGEMVFSKELGKEIPKGWEVKRLNELAKLEMGISPKGSSYNSMGQGLPLLNGAADFNGKSIKPNKYTTSPTKTCKENDIIFCIRGTIGNITFSDSIYCIGRGVSSLSPYKDEYRELIFLSLNQYLNKLIKNAFGSVILGLSKEDISSLLILLPSGNTIKIFHNIVLKLNYLLKNNNIQTQEISELRDSLLPKLMSGEIRVPLEADQ